MPKIYLGIDEVGTNMVAGPIVAWCVYVPEYSVDICVRQGFYEPKIKEKAKKGFLLRHTPEDRKALLDWFTRYYEPLGICHGVCIVDPKVIDRDGPAKAQDQAMSVAALRAINSYIDCHGYLDFKDIELVIDGEDRINGLPSTLKQTPLIRADETFLPVIMAGVLAKATHDGLMLNLHEQYPLYEFNTNKGWPTHAHMLALLKLGPIRYVHRKKNLTKMLKKFHATYLKDILVLPDWIPLWS